MDLLDLQFCRIRVGRDTDKMFPTARAGVPIHLHCPDPPRLTVRDAAMATGPGSKIW